MKHNPITLSTTIVYIVKCIRKILLMNAHLGESVEVFK